MNYSLDKNVSHLLFTLIIGLATLGSARAQQVLQLEDCLKMAKANNNNIRAAQENVEAAKEAKQQRDIAGKPTLDGSVMGFYFGRPLNSLLPEYAVNPGVSVGQDIYSGGRTKLSRSAAAKSLEIEETRKLLTTSDVQYNTTRAYWQFVASHEQVKLARQSIKQLETLYNDFNTQYQAGIIYKNDVLRAKVQLTESELALRRAKDALLIAEDNLKQIIGISDSAYVIIADTSISTGEALFVNAGGITTQADNAEIGILKKSLESAEIQRQLLKAESLPSVRLGANGIMSMGKQGVNPSNNSNFLASYYGMLNVNVPIFDWGVRKRRVREQDHRINAQSLQLKDRTEQINIELKQAYLQLDQCHQRISLTSLSLQQAGENLKLSNDRLKAGTITGRDVLEAQTIWLQAYNNVIDAKIELKIAEANVNRILNK
ncbi:TolC family protein [Filimonas effusa]|nr:TolC family protein [Filimonas effusa]